MRKLIKALILEAIIQVALDAQDVLKAPMGPAFSIEELEGFFGVRSGRGRFAATNNEQPRYAISNRIGTTASMLRSKKH